MDNPSHIDGSRSFRLPTSSFRPPTSSFRRKPESRGQRGGKKLHSNVSNNQPHFPTLVCRRQPARAIAMKACPGLRSGIDGPHRRPAVSLSPLMGKDWGEGEPRSAEACPQASARRRPIFILLCGLRKAIGDSGRSGNPAEGFGPSKTHATSPNNQLTRSPTLVVPAATDLISCHGSKFASACASGTPQQAVDEGRIVEYPNGRARIVLHPIARLVFSNHRHLSRIGKVRASIPLRRGYEHDLTFFYSP
jgi:hypothetical protein